MNKNISYRKIKRAITYKNKATFLRDSAEFICRKCFSEKAVHYMNKHGLFPVITAIETNEQSFNELNVIKMEDGPNIKIVKLSGGFIFSSNGMVITKEGVPVAESVLGAAPNPSPQSQVKSVAKSLNYQAFNNDRRIVIALLSKKINYLKQKSDNITVATPLASRFPNYYHWMINTVPRIRYVQKYQDDSQQELKYIVPLDPPSWVTETISLLGIESSIEWASSPVYSADSVILTSAPTPRLEDYNWIKENILDNKQNYKSDTNNKNIYISRMGAIERRIINEKEVISMLKNYGFERYLLENNSIIDNASLFANANMVVGPHGAGLTDIIFCNEDTTVIELSGKKYNTAYKNIAEKKELNYIHYECEPKATDIYVDVQKLENIIKKNREA